MPIMSRGAAVSTSDGCIGHEAFRNQGQEALKLNEHFTRLQKK